MRKLLYKSDSAENVKANLLSATTERTLVRMNWKVRFSMIAKIKSRCAQFGVEYPKAFAAADVRPRNTHKHDLKLTTSL